jgi:hypothetical protein
MLTYRPSKNSDAHLQHGQQEMATRWNLPGSMIPRES